MASALRPGDPHRQWFQGRGVPPAGHLPIGRDRLGPAPMDVSLVTSVAEQWRRPGDRARPAILAAGAAEGAVGPPARAPRTRGCGRVERWKRE